MRKKKSRAKLWTVMAMIVLFVIALVYVSTFAVEVEVGQVEEDISAQTVNPAGK